MSSSPLSLSPPLLSFSCFSSVPAKRQHNVLVSVVVVQLMSSENSQIWTKYKRCQLFVIYWDILFLHPFLLPPPLLLFSHPSQFPRNTFSLSLLLHSDDFLHHPSFSRFYSVSFSTLLFIPLPLQSLHHSQTDTTGWIFLVFFLRGEGERGGGGEVGGWLFLHHQS